MDTRTFENPQTRERATLVESARETGGQRSVLDFDVEVGGGVMGHFHDVHQERIQVLAGAIEVTVDGVAVASETTLPKRVTQHDLIGDVLGTIRGCERPTDERGHSKRGEEIWC